MDAFMNIVLGTAVIGLFAAIGFLINKLIKSA